MEWEIQLKNKLKKFMEDNYLTKIQRHIKKDELRLTILYKDFQYVHYFEDEQSFETILEEQPETFLDCAELALNEIVDSELDQDEKNPGFKIRVRGIPRDWNVRIRDIRARHLNTFMRVEGFVKSKSSVRPNITMAKFECPSCTKIINIIQADENFNEPKTCGCGRKGKFYLKDKKLIDAYSLLIEEPPEILRYGTQLSTVKVLLKGDLCDPNIEERIYQGVRIAITGYPKEIMLTSRSGKKKTRLDFYMETNYVEILESSSLDIKLDSKDIEEIKAFIRGGDVLKQIKKIIFKGVYGLQKEKDGMILSCVEGKTDITKSPIIRGKIHCLYIGEPSTGKTTLRQAMQPFLVKWRRVSGKGTTGVGIIGITIRDELTGGWCFECGDLALADNGILFIDELDKLKDEDRDSLHQPMEELELDISKANIHTTLLTRTTIIAGANPKYGRFDPYEDNIYSQITLADTLVNRFDLIFVMQQGTDDEAIKEEAKKAKTQLNRDNLVITEEEKNFMKRLFIYVIKLEPVLSDNVKEYIVDEFEKLLTKGLKSTKKSAQITQRQVGAIKRISEAHAKLTKGDLAKDGKVFVTKKDVDYAIGLIYYSYNKIAFDYETGQVDLDKITVGVTTSQRSQITILKSIVRNLKEKFNNIIPLDDVIEDAKSQGIDEDRAEELIEKMKTKGDLFEPRSGFLSKM